MSILTDTGDRQPVCQPFCNHTAEEYVCSGIVISNARLISSAKDLSFKPPVMGVMLCIVIDIVNVEVNCCPYNRCAKGMSASISTTYRGAVDLRPQVSILHDATLQCICSARLQRACTMKVSNHGP